jgi:hypothetical protein
MTFITLKIKKTGKDIPYIHTDTRSQELGEDLKEYLVF